MSEASTLALDVCEQGAHSVIRLRASLTARERRELGELVVADPGAYRIRVLELGIASWRGPAFTDDSGKPLPLTRENLDALDPDVAFALAQVIWRTLELRTD